MIIIVQTQPQLYTEEERELLGSGNFIIESGGTFYDEDDGGYSDRSDPTSPP